MKKKVGIVTWHYYPNFGSMLQAYSLQTTINNLGYLCEFINYRKEKFKYSNIKSIIKYILSYLSIILPQNMRRKYSFKFSRFEHHYLKQRIRIYNIKNIEKCNKKYDIFVCGSDQIWAPSVFDPIYFLSFVDIKKPKIAYAPSIGLNSIPEFLQNDYYKLLKRFDYLSVREEKGAEILKKTFNLNADILLDPTFLIEREAWNKLAILPKINKDYILCYFLSDNKSQRKSLKKIAEILDCKIVFISNFIIDKKVSDYLDKYAGPCEFLGYIKNAKYIITDSFHGMAFSIIFNKDFYVFERFSHEDKICQNSRINNILNKFNLIDRLISYKGSLTNVNKIDYEPINLLLKKEILYSLNSLKKALLYYS